MTTAASLLVFAALLAWPVPRWLSSARWTHRCPRAAIVLWQSIGLAGGVSALLAAIALAVAPLNDSTPHALSSHARNVVDGHPMAGLDVVSAVGLIVAAALAGRLFGVLASSTYATLRRRHRHRHLVDLTGDEHPGAPAPARPRGARGRVQYWIPLPMVRQHALSHHPAGTHGDAQHTTDACELCGHVGLRILDHPVAVAYCVPGVRNAARVVVSRGLLTTLGPQELRAVLAHEDAHVTGRHDLVIQPFIAWQQTFPFLRPAQEATAAVSLLVEMLADDAAARRTSGKVLARALAQLGVTRSLVPAGTLGIVGEPAGPGRRVAAPTRFDASEFTDAAVPEGSAPPSRSPVIARIVRLLDPPVVRWWQPAAAYAAAVAILAMPALLLTL